MKLATILAGVAVAFIPMVAAADYYPYGNNQYYNNYPSYYQQYNATLTCSSSAQNVAAGQSVTFYAQGGQFSQYNWTTPQQTYYNQGAQLTVTLPYVGEQRITVTNGSAQATCLVNVIGNTTGYYNNQYNNQYSNTYPNYNPYQNYNTGYNNNYPYTMQYVPRLPNTGFEPLSGLNMLYAILVLIGAAALLYPYVRKAFVAVIR